MLICNNPNENISRWKLRLGGFWLWGSTLFGTGPKSIWCIIKPPTLIEYSKTWTNRWWNKKIWFQLCHFGAAVEGEAVIMHIFLDKFLEIINVPTRSHTASHIPFDDILYDDFNSKDCTTEERNPKRSITWLFHNLNWNCWKSRCIIISVSSCWPLKPLILNQVFIKVILASWAADTHCCLD